MKKIVIAILVGILFLSCFIFTACDPKIENTSTTPSGTENSKAAINTENSTGAVDTSSKAAGSDSKTKAISDSFIAKMESKKYSMKFNVEVSSDGQTVVMEATQYVSGENIALIGKNGAIDINYIIKDNKAYTIDASHKTYIVISNIDSIKDLTLNIESPIFISAGTEKFENKNLPYDEYKMGDTTLRIYIDGNRVAGLKSISNKTDISIIKILNISDSFDNSVFDIPSDYSKLG